MLKSSFISTLNFNQASLWSVNHAQKQLADAQKELASGRKADVGVALGYQTETLTGARRLIAESDALKESNANVALRLDVAQDALQSITNDAQDLFSSLMAARSGGWNPQLMQDKARDGFNSLIVKLGTSVAGMHLFSGTNADVAPLSDHFSTPASASRTAIQSAFTTHFGFPPGDPAAGNITGTQLQSFLDNQFAAEFGDPQWGANWSVASDQELEDRISTTQVVETSVSANETGFRKLAQAYSMLTDLGISSLSEDAQGVLTKTASELVSEGVNGVTELRSGLGVVQARVSDANDYLSQRSLLLSRHVEELESVDPAEVSARITTLMSRIEASYSVTARLQRVSLLDALG
jgi:flagellar hook-associated protein 3 FlgL